MSEYKGKIELISGITPKNNGDFPLVNSKDVLMSDGKRLSDLCHFGHKYSDAEKVIDLSKDKNGIVKMYLFPNGDGYDAVVSGQGKIANYSIDDGIYKCVTSGIPESLKSNHFDQVYAFYSNDLFAVNATVKPYFEVNGARPGELYVDKNNIYDVYKCKYAVSGREDPAEITGIEITNKDYFEKINVKPFKRGQYCEQGLYFRYSNPEFDTKKIYRLHIEDGITSIGDYFMYQGFNLKNLTFGNIRNIKHLGTCCFAYTAISGTYEFSDLLDTKIDRPFMQCPNLEGLSFNQEIVTIEPNSFEFCTSLKYVNNIDSNVAPHISRHIGDYAFKNCSSLIKLEIEDPSMTELGDFVFWFANSDAELGYYDPRTGEAPAGRYLDEFKLTKMSNGSVMQGAPRLWKNNPFALSVRREYVYNNVFLPKLEKITKPLNKVLSSNKSNSQYDKIYYESNGIVPMLIDNDLIDDKKIALPEYLLGELFSLNNVYNCINPNTSYLNFKDFIRYKLMTEKLEFSERLYNILSGQETGMLDNYQLPNEDLAGYSQGYSELIDELVYISKKYKKLTEYNIGDYISPLDLPICLIKSDLDNFRFESAYRGEGTCWWAACKALGLNYKRLCLDNYEGDLSEFVQEAKMCLINSISNDTPAVITFDTYDDPRDKFGAHTVIVVGYNSSTDRFLIVGNNWGFSSDVISLKYWAKFEEIFPPTVHSVLWTFDFKGEPFEMDSELIGLRALVSEANRNVLENGAAFKKCMAMMQQILDTMVTHSDQDLSEAQKAQARDNIDAVDENQVLTLIQENLSPNGDSIED